MKKKILPRNKPLLDRVVGFATGKKVKNDTYPGESHGILVMSDGSLERAQYMGPGTKVVRRAWKNQPGKTEVDKISKQHDIAYALARTNEDVVRADRLMAARLKEASRKRKDSQWNIRQANLLKPKILAEKVLGPNKLGFANLKGVSEETRRLLKSHQG